MIAVMGGCQHSAGLLIHHCLELHYGKALNKCLTIHCVGCGPTWHRVAGITDGGDLRRALFPEATERTQK